jgi:RNA polymerase sigma factor (sigma-70 family)
MQLDSDVNPAFEAWRSSTGRWKEWNLQVLVQRLTKFATAICWQRLSDHKDDIEPLVNGIVWRAIQKADQFADKSKFSTWFFRLAINECNMYLRNFMRRCEAPLEEDMPSMPQGVDAKIDLIALLDGLQGEDHLLFRLVAEGQEFKDIAMRLGISSNAAMVRWARLKEKLRNARTE